MRTILIGILLLLFFIVSIPLYLVEWIVGKFNMDAKAHMAQHIVVWMFKRILWIGGVHITVKGIERVPEDGACLFVFNHRSYFDILVGYTTAPKYLGFVSKVEIKKVPFISRWMKFMHCLFLDRKKPRAGMQMLMDGIKLLKSGHSIFIAPEGTRNYKEGTLKFQEGSFKMAEKAKVPVVPVAMNNNDSIFEKHLPWVRSAHVIVEYLEPVRFEDFEGEDKKHVGAYVRERINETIERNAAEI